MGKRIERAIALTIVLFQISYANVTSAGFFDLLSSKEPEPIIVNNLTSDKTALSEDTWTTRVNTISEEPEEPEVQYQVIRESVRQVTAYNVGDIYQNDSTPCTGAYSKVDLCEELERGVNVCAANFVPLHTMLRIFTDDGQSFECIVWDRMNSRYTSRVDIAMSYDEKAQAKQFGLQKLTVQILKEIETNKI